MCRIVIKSGKFCSKESFATGKSPKNLPCNRRYGLEHYLKGSGLCCNQRGFFLSFQGSETFTIPSGSNLSEFRHVLFWWDYLSFHSRYHIQGQFFEEVFAWLPNLVS
jgi:hypothetical protein